MQRAVLAYGQVNHVFSTNSDGGGALENIASRSTIAGYAVGVEWGVARQGMVKADYPFSILEAAPSPLLGWNNAQFVSVELTYRDGSVSEIKSFRR